MKFKKKAGVVSDLVNGTGGLIIGVVLIFVIVSTILGANLLTDGGVYDTSADNLASNFTSGVDNVATKIPTVMLIAAVVLLFGVLVVLYMQYKRMGIGAGGGAL